MAAHIRRVVVLACTLMILAGAAGTATGAGETTVSLAPATDEITTGSTTTVEIIVENASDGVGAVNATISLSTESVATISNVSLDDSAIAVDVEMNAANTSATVTGYGLNTNDTGQIVVGRVSLQGESTGDADVTLQMNALGDESGIDYSVTSTTGTNLSVSSPSDGSDGGGGTTPTPTTTTTESPTPTTTQRPTTTSTEPVTTEPITTTTETSGSQAPGFEPLSTGIALLCTIILILARSSD
jgi:hypothetical protein